jgi:cobalt-zinc-cadmium efflux system outer membrane protein
MSLRIYLLLCLLLASAGHDVAAGERLLHLGEVDQLVGERNRTLIAARRASEAGEAGLVMAGARPNPVVSLNSSGLNSRHPANGGNLDSILRIDQTVERGGKRDLRLAVADALLQANRADESDSLRQQRLFARQAYFDLKAAEERARLSGESARLARQVLAKAELRLKAGDLSPADVARIRTDALKAESDASQASVDQHRGQQALAYLLALEGEAFHLVTADPWPNPGPLPDYAQAIDERPDVQAAMRRQEAAERAISLARSQQVRDVTVGAQIERAPNTVGNPVYGLGVSVPLFTGYDFRGEIRRAHVDRDAANDELERLRANAAAEFAQAAFEAERLGERARSLRDEALPAAQKAHAAVQLAFSQGATSALDVIDARRSLYAIESDTTGALADAAKARAAWAAAINRPDLP